MCFCLHKLFFTEIQCPVGCDCKSATKCQWSTDAINLMSVMPRSNPSWKIHSARFLKQICDGKNRHVCCCGPDQVSPDKCKSRNMTNIFVKLDLLNIAQPKPLIWFRQGGEYQKRFRQSVSA